MQRRKRQLLSQNYRYYLLNQDDDKNFVEIENQKTILTQTTQSHILDSRWIRANIHTMENLMELY